MDKWRKITLGDKRTYKTVAMAFIMICILVGIACFQYYKQLQDTVASESQSYMQEISKQMSTMVSKTIKDNFSALGTIATVLQYSDVTSYDQLQAVTREQKNYWNYQKILLVDENGIAHDEEGKTVLLSNDAYLQEVIVGKKPSMSASQMLDGEESVIFAIPLNDLVIGNTKMRALAASYDLSTFDKILSMTAFNGMGYAHIVRKDGTIVIRSSSKHAAQSGYNVITSLQNAEMNAVGDVDKVKADIANERSGQVEYTLEGVRKYMNYTPLQVQNWSLLTFVPVSVVNAKSELLLKITWLLCGFITLAFSFLIAFLLLSFYRNKRRLEQIAYIDPVTGGHTIQRFYELAQKEIKTPGNRQYALVYTNIEKFKVLNEQFGRNACDEILRGIENSIDSNLNMNECIGRISADNFCVLIEYGLEAAAAERFDLWYKGCTSYIEKNDAVWLPLIIEFGVYVINNDSMPFPSMIDRAKLALTDKTRELRGKLRYAIYDEQLRQMLFREKQLEDMMEESLANQEFQVYLQPKYITHSEQIGGAEALVRWSSVSEGMIYPDEFISLFEKNGFIIQLDLWVFEEVCRTIRKWLNTERKPVKISVNCSRMHLKNPRFFDRYCAIAKKYDIPPTFIEIELTETTVFNNVEQLVHTIEEIQQAGFGCAMDDFGSGYSSLNLIQDIPVDTLKLDKIFFRNGTKDLQRTESIISSIVSMAKALSMQTVAEGVEHRSQVDMLRRLNCDYIQGYVFAKPMPIPQFEELLFQERTNTGCNLTEVFEKC